MKWAVVELSDEEKKYWYKTYYCPHCKKATKFLRCDNCGRFYCAEHAIKENDSTWEMPDQPDYLVCYHCCKFWYE